MGNAVVAVSRGKAEAGWRRRLNRFAKGGGTVAAFCEAESVSVPSFYYWRRKLAEHVPDTALRAEDGGLVEFIDLGTERVPGGGNSSTLGRERVSAIEVQIDLGAGIVLRIRRG